MRLGFLINNLEVSQLSHCFLSEAGSLPIYMDTLCFTLFPCPIKSIPLISVMQIYNTFSFNGVAIATDLSTAEKLIDCPGPSSHYFYVWDLEWVGKNYNYSYLSSIYCNPRLKLIARSPSHAKVISDCWNRLVEGVVSDFNMSQFAQICGEKND